MSYSLLRKIEYQKCSMVFKEVIPNASHHPISMCYYIEILGYLSTEFRDIEHNGCIALYALCYFLIWKIQIQMVIRKVEIKWDYLLKQILSVEF